MQENQLTSDAIIGDILPYLTDPALIQDSAVSLTEQMLGAGVVIASEISPFVRCLEASSAAASAAVVAMANYDQRRYPQAAASMSDLYYHMSTEDCLRASALPGKGSIMVAFDLQEVLKNMVDVGDGIRQLTIPKSTVFTVATTPMGLYYPVNIRQLGHGHVQVVYDNTVENPLKKLATNVVPSNTATTETGRSVLIFELDVWQFSKTSIMADANATGPVRVSVPLTDQLYCVRAFTIGTNGQQTEIPVGYAEEVYDVETPSAIVRRGDKDVTITIPYAYTKYSKVRGKVRFDVYQTKGNKVLDMSVLRPSDFKADFKATEPGESTASAAALNKVTVLSFWSKSICSGGRDALSFEELRQRVIKNTVSRQDQPITADQVQSSLSDKGYSVVLDVDTLTARNFRASKPLPSPKLLASETSSNLITPADAAMLKINTSVLDLQTSHGCVSHDLGATITSSALFKGTEGSASLVSETDHGKLLALPPALLADTLRAGNYFYTPFHYVLDTSDEKFSLRAYSLDSPTTANRNFIRENTSSGMQVSIGTTIVAEYKPGLYVIKFMTASSDAYKDLADGAVGCQLSFKDAQGAVHFVEAVQLPRDNPSDERVFQFTLSTNFAVNSAGYILLTNMLSQSNSAALGKLEQVFDVTFTTSESIPGIRRSLIDDIIDSFGTSNNKGLTHEQFTMVFGKELTHLRRSYRTFADSIIYKRYEADIPDTYAADVYKLDPISGAPFTIGPDGKLVQELLHRRGDIKKTPEGEVIYRHRAGEIVKDPTTGAPVPVDGYRTRVRHLIEVMAIGAEFYFANDAFGTRYRDFVRNSLVQWITEDMQDINDRALERTSVDFYPVVTSGNVNVTVSDGVELSIPAAQRLRVKLYVPTHVYTDQQRTSAIRTRTLEVIGQYLGSNYVYSVSELLSILSAAYGQDVRGAALDGFGGASQLDYLAITDRSHRLGVAKVLLPQAGQTLTVQDDVSVSFVDAG